MAGQGKVAEVRVFRTTDGKLVGEHDPRGAFLAYAAGDEVPAERVEEYDKVRGGHLAEADYALLREQQVNHVPASPEGERVYVHEDLATELADQAQEIANLPTAVRVAVRQELHGDDAVIADRRLSYTEDRDRLVPSESADGAFLAYIPGDRVKVADLDMYEEMNADKDSDEAKADDADAEAKARAQPPANKARAAATTKAAATK